MQRKRHPPHRRTQTWTISLPPEMGKFAQRVARQEHRTKSELVREALRRYLAQRTFPLSAGASEHLTRVGELTELYRQRHATRQPNEAQLRAQLRGVRRLHERLKHLAP